MNTRPLSRFESDNLAALNDAGISSTLLFITATGLEKGILDATDPMREMLSREGLHEYLGQKQGPEGKLVLEGNILDNGGPHAVRVSLYRPVTKNGDPRMWFYGMGQYAKPNDVMAVFVLKRTLCAINLTSSGLAQARGSGSGLEKFFLPFWRKAHSVSEELLDLLRKISTRGPLEAVCSGDTAIGRSIESALGIKTNSSPQPDYRGIEIKAGRSSLTGRENRANLFACVPDWSESKLKSSAEILGKYGYSRDKEFKLYCTVSVRSPNAQGLQLTFDEAMRWLREVAVKAAIEDVAIWKMSTLERRLNEKHPETFWIKAQAEKIKGKEYFHLKSVTHTRDPNLMQMERLLVDGAITLDHLIKRKANGRTAEKGPLFKIERKRIGELFLGTPKEYSLCT